MNVPTYVQRRGELLGELFLRELNPSALLESSKSDIGWHYLLIFNTSKGQVINIAVEIKATEESIANDFTFNASSKFVRQIEHSNLPLLILIVDVKKSNFGWAWASSVEVSRDPADKLRALIKCSITQNTPEAIERLKAEIDSGLTAHLQAIS